MGVLRSVRLRMRLQLISRSSSVRTGVGSAGSRTVLSLLKWHRAAAAKRLQAAGRRTVVYPAVFVYRKKEAAGILRPKVDTLLARYAKVTGRAPSHITLRTMTSRWGSCTPATRRIRLNLALAYMPEELLEYVLVHEMVHLYEKGHGKGFRDRMDMYLPGWRSRRYAINQYTIY